VRLLAEGDNKKALRQGKVFIPLKVYLPAPAAQRLKHISLCMKRWHKNKYNDKNKKNQIALN